ncbi:uncharacterized protein L969DRAFT_561530 [Mixia osmundae IAM 14324]|uniref:Tetraspanin Tsp2 n=1 Tax=Mixia osmundae (strain CBS 9802 / IAM 14324 / JCM 22182 / KY 12970) TaxID=764103 RepID=G7DSE1_MIXOS|nr:uncharacterized protein L969DRAFT_561530 [Mixia osmundae IAM 14324]KEI38005.1 hypothetical protein L969DRAFT_561530 [Mixia osmundae IAM 14324]GAA93501.1 hypothetical protein E5Q_00142 [Mixia osmundae IAM 14324]
MASDELPARRRDSADTIQSAPAPPIIRRSYDDDHEEPTGASEAGLSSDSASASYRSAWSDVTARPSLEYTELADDDAIQTVDFSDFDMSSSFVDTPGLPDLPSPHDSAVQMDRLPLPSSSGWQYDSASETWSPSASASLSQLATPQTGGSLSSPSTRVPTSPSSRAASSRNLLQKECTDGSLPALPALPTWADPPRSRRRLGHVALAHLSRSRDKGKAKAAQYEEREHDTTFVEDLLAFLSGQKRHRRRILGPRSHQRWLLQKWLVYLANWLLTAMGLTAMTLALMTWFNAWGNAIVLQTTDAVTLRLATAAAALMLLSASVGHAAFASTPASLALLSVFNLLLWPCLALSAAVGYISYKKRTFRLDAKMLLYWRSIGLPGRRTVQNRLSCCGLNDPFTEAALTALCYPRAQMQGCKGPLIRFERKYLYITYAVAFAVCGLLLLIIASSIVCSKSTEASYAPIPTDDLPSSSIPTHPDIYRDHSPDNKSLHEQSHVFEDSDRKTSHEANGIELHAL